MKIAQWEWILLAFCIFIDLYQNESGKLADFLRQEYISKFIVDIDDENMKNMGDLSDLAARLNLIRHKYEQSAEQKESARCDQKEKGMLRGQRIRQNILKEIANKTRFQRVKRGDNALFNAIRASEKYKFFE